MNKTMMIVTGVWNNKKTFKLIPVSPDAPYNEVMLDIDSKVLAIVGKEKKETFHMMPKLNEFGDLSYTKIGKRANGKDYAEERKTLETFYEYYLENRNEIETLVSTLAINADTYDFKTYLDLAFNASEIVTLSSPIVTV